MNVTSITLDKNLKKRLDILKKHKRESYNDVIARLLSSGYGRQIDNEGLIETIEILSDPETMRSLAKSMEQLKRGKLSSIDEV